jgi:hypothetical protein
MYARGGKITSLRHTYLGQKRDTLVVFFLGVHELDVGGVEFEFVIVGLHILHLYQFIIPAFLHSSRRLRGRPLPV